MNYKVSRVLIISIIFVSLLLNGCNYKDNASSIKIKPYQVKGLDTTTTGSGLKFIMVKRNPNGKLPNIGKEVKVHYTGYLDNGKVFDSSVSRGNAFSFLLGIGQVIKGWDEGIALLHEGEQARLIIPYNLAYGIEGSGPIPPMSTLIFDVELIASE